jgi:hypothetical protein
MPTTGAIWFAFMAHLRALLSSIPSKLTILSSKGMVIELPVTGLAKFYEVV